MFAVGVPGSAGGQAGRRRRPRAARRPEAGCFFGGFLVGLAEGVLLASGAGWVTEGWVGCGRGLVVATAHCHGNDGHRRDAAAAVPAATVVRFRARRPWPGRRGAGCRPRPLRRPGRGEVAGGGAAQQQRRDDRREVGVDLGQLEVHRGALAALVQVRLDLGGVALREPFADIGAQVLVDPAALGRRTCRRGARSGRPGAGLHAPGRPARRPSWRSCRAAARCRPASGPRPRGATAPAASARAARRRPSRRHRTRSPARRCRGTARPGRTAPCRRTGSAGSWRGCGRRAAGVRRSAGRRGRRRRVHRRPGAPP